MFTTTDHIYEFRDFAIAYTFKDIKSTTFTDEHPVWGSRYPLLSLSERFRYNILNCIHNNNNNNGYEYNDNIMAADRDICVTIVSKLKRRQMRG